MRGWRWVPVLLLWLVARPALAEGVTTTLAVTLEPAARTLVGEARLVLPAGRPVNVLLAGGFEVDALAVDGVPFDIDGAAGDGVRRWSLPAAPAARALAVRWHGDLAPLDAAQTHRDTLGPARAVADAAGSFLPAASFWYPRVEDALGGHRVTLDLPADQRGLVPGRLVEASEADGRWRATFEFEHPGDGIDLMAGPYTVTERPYAARDGRTLALRTWFHPELADLAAGYLESAAGYLALYEDWIGDYPFAGFDVVSSPTPTGFGMPGLTYLGVSVLRLPFIRHTSLGHEVLHNWWGNGVYVDYAQGNWAEGLTTLMADYEYAARGGEEAGVERRLGWLRDFAAVPPGDDRPLAEFVSRRHGASQVVGYHKVAMLFLMLRDRLGVQVFDRALAAFWDEYRFRVAGWRELRAVFERVAGRDLGDAFEPWLRRPGAPSIVVDSATATGDGVRVRLRQAAPAWPLVVPIRFETAAGPVDVRVPMDGETTEFEQPLAAPASAVLLDPGFRLFRHLAPGEAPPILRDLMLAPAVRVVALDGIAPEAAMALAGAMLDGEATRDDAPGAPVLVVGTHAAVDAWLGRSGSPVRPAVFEGFTGDAAVWVSDAADGRPVGVVSVDDEAALARLARPLPHYGRQSWIGFEAGRASRRGTWPARPVRAEVRAP